MSKSLIYTVNSAENVLAIGDTIPLGSVIRRYGCDIILNGNAISLGDSGYYDVNASVTLVATAAGPVTVTLYQDGVAVPGATATITAAAGDNVAFPITAQVRVFRCGASNLSLVVSDGAATTVNVAVNVERR